MDKENRRTIWIINEYAGSRYHGMEFRHYYLGRELTKKGYNVYIITASFSHLFKKLPEVNENYTLENIDGISYVWVKVPRYKHAHDKKRVLKWFMFTMKLFKLPSYINKPDFIIVSPMAPFPILAGYYYARRYRARLIYEVKDIWPLSVVELGNYSKYHPLIMLMQWCENFAYKKADAVVSVLPNAKEHMIKHGMAPEKFYYIPNGFSLDDISRIEPLDINVEKLIPKNKFIIGYVGTIGYANALENLIQAAKILEAYKDIHFVIVGDGKEKENLLNLIKDLGLENVTFTGHIPKSQVQTMLEMFDVCYIGWRKKRIYEYGISANKIFEYMYSAKPILHAYSGKGDLIKEASCGISVEAENPQAIADAIIKLYSMSDEQRNMLGENGRRYVLENHTYKTLAEKLITVLENLR